MYAISWNFRKFFSWHLSASLLLPTTGHINLFWGHLGATVTKSPYVVENSQNGQKWCKLSYLKRFQKWLMISTDNTQNGPKLSQNGLMRHLGGLDKDQSIFSPYFSAYFAHLAQVLAGGVQHYYHCQFNQCGYPPLVVVVDTTCH